MFQTKPEKGNSYLFVMQGMLHFCSFISSDGNVFLSWSSLHERNEPELLSGTTVFDLLIFGTALSSFLQYSAISGQLGEKWQRSDVAWLIGNNSREKRLKGCCLITGLGSQVVSSLNLTFSSPTLLYKYIGKNGNVLCALLFLYPWSLTLSAVMVEKHWGPW